MGNLTTYDISKWLLLAFVIYGLCRFIFLAPYRLWQEQCITIGDLREDIGRPERIGAEQLHRLRAEKRLEMAAALQEYQHANFKAGRPGVELMYDRLANLMGMVNPPQEFRRLLYSLVQEHSKERPVPDPRTHELVGAMTDYLHGQIDEAALTSARQKYERQ